MEISPVKRGDSSASLKIQFLAHYWGRFFCKNILINKITTEFFPLHLIEILLIVCVQKIPDQHNQSEISG